MVDDPARLVEAGYDHIAERYLASKPPLGAATEALLEALVAGLSPTAAVLDLGCGAGVPVTRWLAERVVVTGVDLSAVQLALAERHVPSARFIKADMAAVGFPPATFDGVVAFYSIIHVPRTEHGPLFARIGDWLRPGGRFLTTVAIHGWQGEEADWEGWGARMWWSNHDSATTLALLEAAGLVIERAEQLTGAGETWLWVLARKPSDGR